MFCFVNMCTSSLIDAGIDPTGKIASRCDQLHGIRALAVFFLESPTVGG